MKKFLFLALPVMVGSWLVSTTAFAQVAETESNNTPDSSQSLSIPPSSSLSVSAVLGTIGDPTVSDLDFYSIQGSAGDVVSIDIDNAAGGAQAFDSVVALFGPGPTYTKLAENDDSPLDPGSTSPTDSAILGFTLPESGVFTVGVSNFPRGFENGGELTTVFGAQNGDYTLVVSGLTGGEPLPLGVTIDIKPGTEPNKINMRKKKKVKVAILSTPTWNAKAEVSTSSLTFGRTGDENSLIGCKWNPRDVNFDGFPDLICKFDTKAAGFQVGDAEGHLKGRTTGGQAMEGSDMIKIKWHRDHRDNRDRDHRGKRDDDHGDERDDDHSDRRDHRGHGR